MTTDLKYPEMRSELMEYLSELADRDYQRQNWLPQNSTDGIPRSQLDYSVHFFLDDTSLLEEPERCIGFFLRDMEEANLAKQVSVLLKNLFKKYGVDMSDEEYIAKPEWSEIIAASQRALKKFEQA